jgi:hypothetical protein
MRPWADILIDTYFTGPDRGWVVGGKTDQPVPTRSNVKPVVLFTEDGGQISMMITVPAHASRLTVRIWDRFGDRVRTLVDEANPSGGSRILMWDRTDGAGQPLPPGYFIGRVTVDETSESRLVQVKKT